MEVPIEQRQPPKSWREELASLVDDTGTLFNSEEESEPEAEKESFKDQIKGFAKAWGEIVLELVRGSIDVVKQTYLTEDSYIVTKTRSSVATVSQRLSFLNEFLPEDRDPVHVWPVIFFVFLIALAVLSGTGNRTQGAAVSAVKTVSMHPPSAERIQLPDGRYLAYRDIGVPADTCRYSLIVPHGFLSSRLAGIPGIKVSLLEEFGVRLISYDLPGFGESDPHPQRDLNSSALDISYLAESVGVKDKFWVLGYSSGSLHAWAALKYVPDKIAGAVMFAPLINPYDGGMTKEEKSKSWENWTRRKKWFYYLSRRFPKLLAYFYRRTFFTGKHGQIDKWLSISLGKKDKDLVEKITFEELWYRDVEESIRQGNVRPFVEEAILQVSNWGFSLTDLQVQEKCRGKSIFSWLQFMYGEPGCVLTGFLGPIHIWQGMDDLVVPPSMTDYVARILPNAHMHRLPEEGHFSYFFLCDECHREVFSATFGIPEGPLSPVDNTLTEEDSEEASVEVESPESAIIE